jgi:hypothetical protein
MDGVLGQAGRQALSDQQSSAQPQSLLVGGKVETMVGRLRCCTLVACARLDRVRERGDRAQSKG